MVIDTSAILAILLGEPEADVFINAIANAGKRWVAAFTELECAVVITARKGPSGARDLDLLLHQARVEQVGMDAEQVSIARRAYAQFGKGRHPAALNLGDCCSYALAMRAGEPLLFKGDDFSQTDVPAALG
ncbi:MAG: ribonuclease [Deltaproteobacteria bacterium RIFOXYA12_FULL_58_15]|nr:MAG: ribonuclease [Deltaproteobacteria bacterium RIFOXYA12_FULL_58_15]OGR12200.1 MAG: ribonuclease [Deltaproteobacteria bacterium RIFOXYB12_FULL_58_9]